MKPPAEILVTIIVVLVVVWYAIVGGVTAGWYARLAGESAGNEASVVGALWPVSAPVLLGVHVYKNMESNR